jgi:hypothetical protein
MKLYKIRDDAHFESTIPEYHRAKEKKHILISTLPDVELSDFSYNEFACIEMGRKTEALFLYNSEIREVKLEEISDTKLIKKIFEYILEQK